MKNFKELRVWNLSMEFVVDIYKMTEKLPSAESFGLISQINRSVVSIPSNIAEGSSRSSDKDNKRFIEIALGSAFELETQLIIIQQLNMSQDKHIDTLITRIKEIQKMLQKFIQALIKTSKR